jgi:hypothetical protein
MKSRLLATIVAAVLLAGCGSAAQVPGGGRDSKEALVDAYLAALQAGNSNAMLLLVDPRVDARSDVAAVLQKNGGQRLADAKVTYLDEFAGVYIVATVACTNASDGSKLQLTVPVSLHEGRYYLALGQAPPSGNEAGIASPSSRSP